MLMRWVSWQESQLFRTKRFRFLYHL